jgi:LysM repeat protein
VIRTNIYITARQKKTLEKISTESGLSVAELIRRAIDGFVGNLKAKT